MQLLRVLILAPFSLIWLCITNVRNYLFDVGALKSSSFSIPVICVGNLSAGGTGKTPTINYLVSYLLSKGKKVAVISRGYGRLTNGFRIVGEDATAATVGDEPLLFYRRWKTEIVVAVGEKRVPAIEKVLENFPALEVILMDDGYQHRALRPSSSILLTSFQNPFYTDFIMPSGSLREGRRWARRANLVVVTKSPGDLPEDKKSEVEEKVKQYSPPGAEVFFSSIAYGSPVSFGKNTNWIKKVFLVTGIANSKPLVQYLESEGIEVVVHWAKADHFIYTAQEMELIIDEHDKLRDCVILTTEKDFMKMGDPVFQQHLSMAPFFYIPVEFSFSKEKENFEASLEKLITKKRAALG